MHGFYNASCCCRHALGSWPHLSPAQLSKSHQPGLCYSCLHDPVHSSRYGSSSSEMSYRLAS